MPRPDRTIRSRTSLLILGVGPLEGVDVGKGSEGGGVDTGPQAAATNSANDKAAIKTRYIKTETAPNDSTWLTHHNEKDYAGLPLLNRSAADETEL